MNKAIDEVQKSMSIHITEFAVAGFVHDGKFAHRWYIGCDEAVDKTLVIKKIDSVLCKTNDDYAVERAAALPHLFIEILPGSTFLDFLHETGKFGAMNKFPRVLKNGNLAKWEAFLGERSTQAQ